MIPLLDAKRGRLMVILMVVACAQLLATIFVSHSLHRAHHGGMLALIGAAATLAFALEVLQRRMCEGMGLAYTTAVREGLFRHLMAVDPQVITRKRHGAMLLSFVGDMTALRQWVSEGIVRGVLALLALGVLLGWMAIEMPRTALMLGGVALAFGLTGLALLYPLERAVRNLRRYRGRVSAFASERLTASATVQACGRASSETSRLIRRVERLNASSLHRAWITGALRALPHLATTIMLVIAVMSGPNSLGGMAGNVVLIGILGLALRDLARAGELMIPGRISFKRVRALFELPANRIARGSGEVDAKPGLLVLDELRIAEGATTFNAVARPGEILVIDGDPALRSALFRTLAGLSMPLAGTIWWNGSELLGLRASRRRKVVGFASPQLPLVAGSTALNLRYRARDAAQETLDALASRWSVDPQGRSENPVRVLLLRALLDEPPILLLELEDRLLGAAEIDLLRREIAGWPGVVLMATGHRALRQCATRFWSIGEEGIADHGASPALSRFGGPRLQRVAG